MGRRNLGLVFLPMVHAQTNLTAVCKRKRSMEDPLLKADVDFSAPLTLLFHKETGKDRRPPSQQCWTCTCGRQNEWADSSALNSQVIGTLPRIAVSEMRGYDADSKPGPAARVEQNHGINVKLISFFQSQIQSASPVFIKCPHL